MAQKQEKLLKQYNTTVSADLGNLGSEKLPFPVHGQVYVKEKKGLVLKKTSAVKKTNELTTYSTKKPEKGKNYISTGDAYEQESFAITLHKVYKGSRNYSIEPYQYKHKTDTGGIIGFDRGHGIDHADGDAMSSSDKRNYTPQNSYYNRYVRNHLVKNIRKKGGAYREISIYDPNNTIIIDGGTRLPVGFVFLEFDDDVEYKVYYFPNLIDYRTLCLSGYRKICDRFKIDDNGVFKSTVIQEGEVDEHQRAVFKHSMTGHQLLSRRFSVSENISCVFPQSALSVLHKMLAIYNLRQAGELEFDGIEQKAAIVRTYVSKMKYVALDMGSKQKAKARQIFFVQSDEDSGANPERLKKEAQVEQRELIDIMNQCELREEDKEGESLYDLKEAKDWLKRIENQVEEGSSVEDKIRLLELYENPELKNENDALVLKLEAQGENCTIDEKRQIADYFYCNDDNNKAAEWLKAMESQLKERGTIQEKTNAADWYSRGNGVVPCNTEKARLLYYEVLKSPTCTQDEKKRIFHILSEMQLIDDMNLLINMAESQPGLCQCHSCPF